MNNKTVFYIEKDSHIPYVLTNSVEAYNYIQMHLSPDHDMFSLSNVGVLEMRLLEPHIENIKMLVDEVEFRKESDIKRSFL